MTEKAKLDLSSMNDILRATYEPAIVEMLSRDNGLLRLMPMLEPYAAGPRWKYWAHRLTPQRVHKARRRAADAWGVLLHGLPECDW